MITAIMAEHDWCEFRAQLEKKGDVGKMQCIKKFCKAKKERLTNNSGSSPENAASKLANVI